MRVIKVVATVICVGTVAMNVVVCASYAVVVYGVYPTDVVVYSVTTVVDPGTGTMSTEDEVYDPTLTEDV